MLMLSQSQFILGLIDIPIGNLRFLYFIRLISSCCATHVQKSSQCIILYIVPPNKISNFKPTLKIIRMGLQCIELIELELVHLLILNLKIAMDSQSLKDKPKPRSKQRASPKKKKSQSISNRSHESADLATDNMSYFDSVIARINNPQIEVDLKAEISKLITLSKSNPTKSLSLLCQIYSTSPSYFFERPKQSKGTCFIIEFISKEIHFYSVFPLMEQEKAFLINQKFIGWIKEKQTVLNAQQMKKIQQMTKFVLERIMDGQSDRVLDKVMALVFNIPLALGHSKDEIQIRFCQGIIKDLLTNLTLLFDKNIKLSSQILECILEFNRQSFKFLTLNKCSSDNYHLFDFGILSFTSKHGGTCRQILAETFEQTRLFLGIKKDDSQEATDPTKSIQEADYKINAVLLTSSFLRFNSILPPDSHQKKISFIKEVTLLTLLASKTILIRLITQLEKIEKPSVPIEVIRGMFEIAKFCNDVNNPNILAPLLKKIQSIRELERYLKDEKPLPSSKDQDPFQALQKSIEGTLFSILRRIEKSLTSYNLQTYVDLYTENPLTFQSETFVQHIFKGQHEQVVLSFFQGFTARWLHADIKEFHFDYYLLHFLRKCVEEDRIGILGKYISNLPTDSLCKISLQVYKLSFNEENKKYVVPQNGSRQVQFAFLTSGGYCQKYILINQIMPVFSEQLLWRCLVNHIIPSLHFIIVKSYYSVVNYEFKNNDCEQAVMRLISAFENYIDKKMIEEVFSTFQLLHCILFREKQRQNKFSRCQGRLLHVILNKGTNLLAMHEQVRTGRMSAMCSLSLSKEMISQMMTNHQKLNRMKVHFLKSTHSWMQNLRNIKEYVSPQQSYEDIIDTILQLSQNFESREFHQVRYLSHYCSDKYFASLVQHKTRGKVARKQLMSYGFLMILKQAANYFMGKYQSQGIEDIFSITDKEIITYYDVIMRIPVDPTNEREILKAKLAVLYQISDLTDFFNQYPNHRLNQFYKDIYLYSLKKIIVEIAVQNPQYVSKYQREFIFQLRVVAIIEIMKNVETVFEVLPTKEVFELMFEMCFDKHVEIRFLIINSLCSRFKHNLFKKFLAEKYESAALLTTMAAFDTNPHLKTVASRMVKSFRGSGNDCTLGLVILIYSIKHILNLTLRNLQREEYQTFIDSFLNHFHRMWLCEKQEEYSVYCFATRFLQEQRVKFILQKPSYESQIQSYYVEKQGTDYTLQRQMKEYFKKDDFSFEFPPEEAIDPREKMIANIMRSLPLRIFAKIKLIIERKTKGSRILKHRKDIFINWKTLEIGGLLQLLSEKCEEDMVALRL